VIDSGKFAMANHRDSVGFDDKDTFVVEVSLGMVRTHSRDVVEAIYKLKHVDHIQTNR
jgi:hypothetical protein